MSKHLNRVLITIFSLMFTLSMFGLCACGKTSEPIQTTYLNITEQEICIVETFDENITVSCNANSEIIWQTSDESVVTVSNGVITGIRQGVAKITATCGELSDVVNVVVKPFDYLSFSVTTNQNFIKMDKGTTAKILSEINYAGLVLDGKLSFESLDENIVSVSSDGVVTAKAFGVAAVSIKGEYKGKTTSTIVNISVNSSILLSADRTSYDLYIGEDSSVALSLTCYDNDVLVDNPEFTYDLGSNDDVVIIENGELIAKNSGTTIITCTYQNAFGEFASVDIAVRVHSKNIEVLNEKLNISLSSSNDDFYYKSYITSTSDEITSASLVTSEGELPLEIDNGKVRIGRRVGDCTLVLSSRNYNYLFDLNLTYNLEINQDNISTLLTLSEENVVLLEDIDIKRYLLENELEKWNSQVEFNGVFDGNGHTIKNLICGNYGLFKSFSGTMKDVTIISDVAKNGVLGFSCVGDSCIENVILKINQIEKDDFNGALFKVIQDNVNVSLKKTIISLPNNLDGNIGFIAGQSSVNVQVTNCYFIQGNGKVFGESNGNVDVVGEIKTFSDVSMAYETLTKDVALSGLKTLFENVFVIKISNENKHVLKEITNEFVVLTEDITFEWESPNDEFVTQASFTGVLDGQGHSINTILLYENGLFKSFGGTIRNLSLYACLRGGNIAAVASDLCGDAILENVYISLPHSVGGASHQGGVVCYLDKDYTLTIKNSFITGETTEDVVNRGYIAYKVDGKVVLENVYAYDFSNCFIPNGMGEINVESKNYAIYESLENICIDIAENKIDIGEYVESILNELNPIVFIYQSNILEVLDGTREDYLTGSFYLMEDIDMSAISWIPVPFSGSLDGNGHSINNLSKQMFTSHGTVNVKNIAFLNVTAPYIFYSDFKGSLTVQNVYIQTKAELDSFSGVLKEVRAGAQVSFENVCVNGLEVTNNTADDFASGVFVGRLYNSTVTFDNCYAIVDISEYSETVIYNHHYNDVPAPTIYGEKDVDYFICDSITTLLSESLTNINIDLTPSMIAKYVTE